MRRLTCLLLILAAVAVALWGCDTSGLPTQTPLAPASTATLAPTAAPTEAPTQQPATDTPASSPTAQASDTPAPTPTLQDTATPVGDTPTTEAATETPVLRAPPTVTPRPTRTPTSAEQTTTTQESTPTSTTPPNGGQPSPTISAQDGPPTDGWKEVVRVAPGKHRIALTFDAGSTGETIPQVLGTLRDHHVHITMFITGKFAEQYPEGIKQMAADGNEIANHTYSHLDSRTLTDQQLADELSRTDTILQDLTGRTSKPFWRPPYGARNNHVLNVAVAQGYRSIYWTLDSLDSVGQPKTPDFIFNRVTNPPNGLDLDGAIVLQHFGSQASADALPRELDRLQEMGLQVVTVSELLSP